MTAKERAELVVSWMRKQGQELYLGTLATNLIAEFEAAEREAWNAAIEAAMKAIDEYAEYFLSEQVGKLKK